MLREAHLVKFDAQEFDMSGLHKDIVAQASKSVMDEVHDDFTEMLSHILGIQCITVKGSDHLWKATKRCGMGVVCSGEVSDIAFSDLAERDFLLKESVLRDHGILEYFKYKGDGLLVIRSGASLLKFADEFHRNGLVF